MKADVRGQIKSPNGRPLKAFLFFVRRSGKVYFTSTDSHGFYLIEDIPTGNYRIFVIPLNHSELAQEIHEGIEAISHKGSSRLTDSMLYLRLKKEKEGK